MRPFHLAFPVVDLQASREFYEGMLGCEIARQSDRWIDFNFFGHQITAHLVDGMKTESTNAVDGKQVPVRHFGIILEWQKWHDLVEHLRGKVEFLIEPGVRFQGQVGEQATFFVWDPSKNALEFKAFRHDESIFQT